MLIRLYALALASWLLPALGAYAQPTPAPESPAHSALHTADSAAPSAAERFTTSDLLALMADRQKQLHYQGVLTYQSNAGTESFRLQHWVDDGVEYQKLFYLNGPEREAVLRQHAECQSPGARLLQQRLGNLSQNLSELEMLYDIRVLGQERVAGRRAVTLQIVPRDNFRYGHLLSIDRDTGLLLKSLLFDEHQRVLEQFQYVELELFNSPEAFSADTYTVIVRRVDGNRVAGCDGEMNTHPDWTLQWLPEGFAFVGQRRVRGNVDMLMYTDGLSAFSVFLDPIVGQLVIEGHAQRGATRFHMEGVKTGADTYQMTIVGEIPLSVAERMAQSVRRLPAAQTASPTPGDS